MPTSGTLYTDLENNVKQNRAALKGLFLTYYKITVKDAQATSSPPGLLLNILNLFLRAIKASRRCLCKKRDPNDYDKFKKLTKQEILKKMKKRSIMVIAAQEYVAIRRPNHVYTRRKKT